MLRWFREIGPIPVKLGAPPAIQGGLVLLHSILSMSFPAHPTNQGLNALSWRRTHSNEAGAAVRRLEPIEVAADWEESERGTR